MNKGPQCALALMLAAAVAACANSAPTRSSSVRAAFMRAHPCPATGLPKGPCEGWNIDHVVPLKCGGADDIGNMQWLTITDHLAKTKREGRHCRPGKRTSHTSTPTPES